MLCENDEKHAPLQLDRTADPLAFLIEQSCPSQGHDLSMLEDCWLHARAFTV